MPISLVKWTGNKRRQAAGIVSRFPGEIATYYEPFLGGGSVLGRLLDSGIRVGRYEVSDAYAPLIALWNMVKGDPGRLVNGYARLWSAAMTDGQGLYYEIRRSFNCSGCPVEFFYLLRTCRVGHVRINTRGKFTSALDNSRAGVHPDRLRPVVEAWHRKLTDADVQFAVRDYREVASGRGDLLYLDPPYRTDYRYYGRLDFVEFFTWLGSQRGSYLLSLGRHLGGEDRKFAVPSSRYDEHLDVDAGDIPFHRLSGRATTKVSESLYIRRGESWVGQQAVNSPCAGAGEGLAGDRAGDGPPVPERAYDVVLSQRTGGRERVVAGPRRISGPKERRSVPRPSKSEAIRRLLEAVPEVRPAHAQAILAKEGIEISPDLFRVVKMNWLKDRREQEEAERKYKEYWSPEAIRIRVEEEKRRRGEAQANQGRMADYEARLWDEECDSGPPPPAPMTGKSDGILTRTEPQQVEPPHVMPPQAEPAPPPQEPQGLTEVELDALVDEVVRAFGPDEWDEIVADYGGRRNVARQDIAWLLRDLCDHGRPHGQAVAHAVKSLRGHGAPASDEEEEESRWADEDDEDEF